MAPDVMYNFQLMIATCQLVFYCLFTILFFREWRKQKRSENERYIPYALMLLYLLLLSASILMTYVNFFAEQTHLDVLEGTQIFFIMVGTFFITVSGILIFIAERIVRKNTRHFFSVYFIGFSIGLIILKTLEIQLIPGFLFLFTIPLLILFSLFIYKLLWKTSGEIRKKMIIVIVGFGIFLAAILQELSFVLHNEDQILARGPLLLASVLVGYGFYSIPSFTEFDWDRKLRHLYILNKNGLCIFHHAFRPTLTDEDLFGGSLVGIQSLMQEMIKSDKALKVIDHEDAKIIFEATPSVLGVVVADENLYVVHHKLQQLMTEFNTLFGETIKHWVGNLDMFKPLRPIVNRIFEIKATKDEV